MSSSFGLRLDLGNFGGKKKNWKVTCFPVFGLEKITKKKKYGGKLGEKIVRHKW